MRVYHFLNSKWTEKALRKNRLKVSIIDKLNDPFEFHAGFSNPTAEIKKVFRIWKSNISKEFGLLCFSKGWHNPLLWSHYADKHEGFALGFDILDNTATEVDYSDNRPLFNWDRLPDAKHSQEFLGRLAKTKFISWKYEEEVRLFYKLNTLLFDQGYYFCQFDDKLILREVIAGCNSQLSDKQLIEMVKGHKEIVVIKSRMAFKSYKIVKNQQKIWNF